MKKLALILGLIISTVAFGKPAYKQWKKERVDFKRLSSPSSLQVVNFVNSEYVTVMHKKSDWMSLALYISTNRLSDSVADVVVSLATSEPIDFSVGSNTIRLQSTELYATFKFITNSSRSYSYKASITNVSLDDVFKSYGLVHVYSAFKYPALINLTTDGYFTRLKNDMEKEREEQAKELNLKQNHNRFEELKKKYTIKYNSGVNGFEVWSKKPGHDTGEHARFCLNVVYEHDKYRVQFMQFQVLTPQYYPSYMQTGAIHTEDGSHVIRRMLGGSSIGELGWLRNGAVQYGFNYYILYGRSNNLANLEALLNSGKKIYITFSGSGVETVSHWLYGVELEQLKDLIKFIKYLEAGK